MSNIPNRLKIQYATSSSGVFSGPCAEECIDLWMDLEGLTFYFWGNHFALTSLESFHVLFDQASQGGTGKIGVKTTDGDIVTFHAVQGQNCVAILLHDDMIIPVQNEVFISRGATEVLKSWFKQAMDYAESTREPVSETPQTAELKHGAYQKSTGMWVLRLAAKDRLGVTFASAKDGKGAYVAVHTPQSGWSPDIAVAPADIAEIASWWARLNELQNTPKESADPAAEEVAVSEDATASEDGRTLVERLDLLSKKITAIRELCESQCCALDTEISGLLEMLGRE